MKAMVATMRHESFYTTGTFSDPELGIFAGWVALENSFADKQVFFNEKKDIALVFSGESFIESETKNQLKQNGHKFGDRGGDCLAQLYEEQGKAFFENLNGLFSGLLIDRRQRKVFLFNDRYGMERIYWHETPDAFYFASEAKALLRVLPELRRFDEQGVAQFMAYGCTLDGRTLFRGISLLPGGSLWSFENGAIIRRSYSSPAAWESQPALTVDAFESEFQNTFKRILQRYTGSEMRLGISLTAGLDTRMIMACLPETNPRPVCYTFTGSSGQTMDDRIAARVAAACGLEYHLLRLKPDFFSDFAAHADRIVFMTDGCWGISGAHEIYFHQQARGLSPVRLTGLFGSEVFRGVSMFKPQGHAQQLFDPDFVTAVNAAVGLLAAHKTHPVTFALFKEIPWNRFSHVTASRSQVVFRTPYLDNELAKLAYQMPPEIRRSSLPASRFVCTNSKVLGKIATDRGFSDDNSGLAYLWRRIFAEVTFKMDYCHGEGLPQPLTPFNPVYRFAVSAFKVAGMHKFLQYRQWFRKELAEYVRQSLSEAQAGQNRFFNVARIRHLAELHAAGRKNYAAEIDAVLTLDSVERQLFRDLPRGLEPARNEHK